MSDWDASDVARATPELTALVLATRRDWQEAWVTSAITAAGLEGMTWPQIAVGLVRLMVDPEASPRDLAQEAPSPLAAKRDPSVAREWAASIRESLEIARRPA